jgi:hypothetical protein
MITYSIYREPKRDITDPKEFETSGYDRESMKECWRLLDLTSRSFSRVIKELDGELARVVSVDLAFTHHKGAWELNGSLDPLSRSVCNTLH